MRALLTGMLFFVLITAQAGGQTVKALDNGASKSDLEQQKLRDLLASQSAELQATREELRQLQQRVELLEAKFRAQNNAPATKESAVEPNAGDTRNPGPRVETVALRGDRKIQGGSGESRSTNQDAKSDSIELANGRVRIGTLLYADYGYYAKTGFGPQFTSQINPPGPGNNSYNTFEITSAYINLFYSPNDAVTFRLTPDLYRQIGAAPGTKIGKVSAIGPNTDQGLPFRLEYAYMDFNTLFASSDTFKKDKLTVGQPRGGRPVTCPRLLGLRKDTQAVSRTAAWYSSGEVLAISGKRHSRLG